MKKVGLFLVLLVVAVLVTNASPQMIPPHDETAIRASKGNTENGSLVDDYFVYANFDTSNSVYNWGYECGAYKIDDTTGNLYVARYENCDVYLVSIPAGSDPTMHPDNPYNPGPMAPRTLTWLETYDFGADCGWYGFHHAEFYVDANFIYYGPDNYGVGGIEKWEKNPDGTFGAYVGREPIPVPPSNGETFGYDAANQTWYTCTRGRAVYGFEVGVDVVWQYEFTYPSYGGDHHDGLEFVGGDLWVSDMTSDFLGRWRYTGIGPYNGWTELNRFSYTNPDDVEGMGFGPLGHFWVTGIGRLYELGGPMECWINDIPDLCVVSGETFQPFDLDDYIPAWCEFGWSHSGGINIDVDIDTFNVVTATYPGGWTGSEVITFIGTLPDTTEQRADVTFTVDPFPVVGDIPDQTAPFVPFDLDYYLSGIDSTQVTWTASGMNCLEVDINPTTHVVTVTNPGDTCTEAETITFTATATACGEEVSDGDQAIFTPQPFRSVVWIPDTCVYQGKMACIPVYLDSLPPWSVYSAQMVLLYDESVIQATHAATENSIAELWGTPTYNIGTGWIAIAMAGTVPLDSTGVLVWVCFDVVGDIGDTTLLTFEGDHAILNDSTFMAKEGIIRVCPEEYDICGRVRYCLNDEPVDSAQMMISGGKDDTVYTDAGGNYQFTNLPVGLDYVVRGDKADDDRGAISAFDASVVLRYVVGLLDLSACQMIAGDVTGNCWVNAYDASFILKHVVGLITQFPVGKDWKFIPDDFSLDTTNWCTAPDSIFYEDLSEDMCCEDWKGILYGDLSGNWYNVLVVQRDHPEDVLSRLVVREIQVNPGDEFVVPIQVEDIFEVYSAELTLSYDNSLLSLVSVAPGELLSGYYFEKNLIPGEIRLATAGTQPIQGSGELVNLTFKVLPQAQEGITTELQVSHFCLNEASSGGLAFSVSIGAGAATHPMDFSLSQNYPNPFNPETEIGFTVPVACQVQLKIYNVAGQLVKIYQGDYGAGVHSISWDGTNLKGEDVGSGIYFYRMEASNFVQQKKMVLMR